MRQVIADGSRMPDRGGSAGIRRVGDGAREDDCCVQMATPSRETERVMVSDEIYDRRTR